MSRYNNSEQLQYAQHTRDYYKGKSFHIHGEWVLGQHYFNDDFITSWVTYKGALLYCKKSHISNLSTEPILEYEGSIVSGIKPNEFWEFALSGVPGQTGEGIVGEKGAPGPAGISAIHVGPLDPVTFKETITDPDLKHAYTHAHEMLWVDTKETFTNKYLDTVYKAYQEAGGALNMPEFKDAFAKLSNKYIDSEIYTSNLVSKAGLKNDYNISVYSNYNHKTKTLDFVINNYDPNKFYYILVASRNPKTPAKWSFRNGRYGKQDLSSWINVSINNALKEFYKKNSFDGFPLRIYKKASLYLPLLIEEEFMPLNTILKNVQYSFATIDDKVLGVQWIDGVYWPEDLWKTIVEKILISTRTNSFFKNGFYVKNPITFSLDYNNTVEDFTIDLTTNNYFKQIIEREYKLCVVAFDAPIDLNIGVANSMNPENPNYISHSKSEWTSFKLTMRSSKLKEKNYTPEIFIKQL